jgi:hypothetical protein
LEHHLGNHDSVRIPRSTPRIGLAARLVPPSQGFPRHVRAVRLA